jgi:2'-5' RNA ligase
MRLFFAVHTGTEIAGQAWRIIQDSAIRSAPWRWIRPENYHFTLKFLGEVYEELLPALHDAARLAASRARPFRLTMGGIGGFPNLARPRVIYFGIERGFGELRDLAGLIEDECEAAGFKREKRRFRAHLTLARVKRPVREDVLSLLRGLPPLGETAFVDVESFVLMKSNLTPSGAVYEEAGRFELGR